MRQIQSQDHQSNAYLEELYLKGTSIASALAERLKRAKDESAKLGKDGISISTTEGKLVAHFVRESGCKKFVEIGTLTGYSSLWILEGMGAEGKLFTLEKDPVHAAIARETLKGLLTEVIEGDARKKLEELSAQGPFDGVFIDGNKSAYLDYLNWAEKNIRPGGLILADNVFLSGAVWGAEVSHFSKKQVEVMQEFNRRLSDVKKFRTIFVPTSEGLAVAEKI